MSLSVALPEPAPRRIRPPDNLPPPGDLGRRLGAALEAEAIRYCRWTGYGAPDRWTTGDGDLDLLVDRRSLPVLAKVLHEMGFKFALAPAGSAGTGVLSFLGRPVGQGGLIHLHVHTRLLVGRLWARSYDLPLSGAVLESAVQGTPFRRASPECALVLFVLRMTLRHNLRDVLRGSDPDWLLARQAELWQLETETTGAAVTALLARHLPEVSPERFAECLGSLRVGVTVWQRLNARRQLQRRLASYALRPETDRWPARFLRFAATAGAAGRKRLAGGGVVIALTGSDGAGKSTAARRLVEWLGRELLTLHAHLGRPPRSLLTLVAGAALKAGRVLRCTAPFLELLRSVGTARDRYRLARRARRVAGAGGVAICERFPLPECYAQAGPSGAEGLPAGATGRVAAWLRRLEADYYVRIGAPDLVLVLAVDPETAVRRKPDEPEGYVRERARVFQRADWSGRRAELIDAGRPLEEVMATLRARVWEAL